MTHDAFISYSINDAAMAEAICTALEAQELKCWYAARNIPGGADWEASIVDALTNSRVMILVWSSVSDQSKQVKREVALALDEVGITLIPFRIEQITSSKLKYYLHTIQALDASKPPLEQHLKRLTEQVRKVITNNSDEASSTKERRHVSDSVRTTGPAEPSSPAPPPPPDEKLQTSKPTEPAKKRPRPSKKAARKKSPSDAGTAPAAVAKIRERLTVEKTSNPASEYAELLAVIQEALKGHTDSHVFVGNKIPADKLANAIAAYAQHVLPKDALLLYDNTFFGGAKDGLLLTRDSVYWRNSSSSVGQIRYVDIPHVGFFRTNSYFQAAKIELNKGLIDVNASDSLAESTVPQSTVLTDKNTLAQVLTVVIRQLSKHIKRRAGVE